MAYQQKVYQIKQISPPEGQLKWSAMQARSALAQSANNVANQVFHRDENGDRIQQPADIRFIGGQNSFGATFINQVDEATEFSLIKAMMHYAAENDAVFDVYSQTCDISLTQDRLYYHCIIVVGRSNKRIPEKTYGDKVQPARFKSRSDYNLRLIEDETFRNDQIIWSIAKGIAAQFHSAREQGHFTLTEGAFLGRFRNGELNRRSVTSFLEQIVLEKVDMLSPAKKHLPRFSVKFSMPVKLRGNWAAGRLRNKGYGRITQARKW